MASQPDAPGRAHLAGPTRRHVHRSGHAGMIFELTFDDYLPELSPVCFYVPIGNESGSAGAAWSRAGLVVHLGHQNRAYLADEFSSFVLIEPQWDLPVSDLVLRRVGVPWSR